MCELEKYKHNLMVTLELLEKRDAQLQASQAEARQKDAEAAAMREVIEKVSCLRDFSEEERAYADNNHLGACGLCQHVCDTILRNTTAGASILQRLQAKDEQIKAMASCPSCKFNDRKINIDPCKSCDKDHSNWQWKGGAQG